MACGHKRLLETFNSNKEIFVAEYLFVRGYRPDACMLKKDELKVGRQHEKKDET